MSIKDDLTITRGGMPTMHEHSLVVIVDEFAEQQVKRDAVFPFVSS